MTSQLEELLLEYLNEEHQIEGTKRLASKFNADKQWMMTLARRLAAHGAIVILPSSGGRGHKTVYKRNRNQPGNPRKHRTA